MSEQSKPVEEVHEECWERKRGSGNAGFLVAGIFIALLAAVLWIISAHPFG